MKEKSIPFRFLAPPAAFAFICIFSFALDLYLTAKERRMRAEWDSRHRISSQGANRAAETLNGLSIKVGIILEPGTVAYTTPDFEVQSKKLERIWPELNHHIRAEAGAPGFPDSIPEATRRFLSESQSDIAQIKKHLLLEKSPVWSDENLRGSQFFPTLKGILRLHHLLAADALLQLTQGDSLSSEESLTACWKLNESVRSRKEPISVFVALKCSSIQMGLSGKLSSIPEVWQKRFDALEYRKSLATAVSDETARLFDALNEKSVRRDYLINELSLLPEWGKQPAAILLDPYLRICRLNFLASEKEFILALQNSKSPVDAPKRENSLLSEYLHEYESMNTTLLEFEKKQKAFITRLPESAGWR